MRSGASQWRVPCPHKEDQQGERSMGSEVSSANLSYFLEEQRVADDVDQEDLERWLGRARASDGSLVVCNECRRVLIVADGSWSVVHEGQPRGSTQEVLA